MKIFILFFLLIFSLPTMAQEALKISKTGSDKVKLFEENKRVKVKTVEGEKHIGRFQIIDDQNIAIKGKIIPLSSIANIKSRSVVGGIAGTFLIVYGAVVLGVGLIVGSSFGTQSDIYIVGGMGAVIMASGILFNEFAKNHRDQKWSYKIVD